MMKLTLAETPESFEINGVRFVPEKSPAPVSKPDSADLADEFIDRCFAGNPWYNFTIDGIKNLIRNGVREAVRRGRRSTRGAVIDIKDIDPVALAGIIDTIEKRLCEAMLSQVSG